MHYTLAGRVHLVGTELQYLDNIAIADVDVARRRDAMKASRDRSAGYAGER